MARAGLYKTEVKKARDALRAQGKHPSVDAVRVALGNTGSKTTIHKYLKELEEEEGGTGGRKASISEALQDLVERLAAQLQDETNTQIDALRTEHTNKERQHAETLATARQEAAQLQEQLQRIETALQQERESHNRTRDTLQQEAIARHTAEQQVADLKEHLVENEAHRRSLEEKHQHAREALEHYRASVKEQREQDARRHEQQVQQMQAEMRQLQQSLVVKQEEVTRLNQEGARLVGDLSHAKAALFDRDTKVRQQEKKLETMQAFEERCRTLEAHLTARDADVAERKAHLDEANKQIAALHQQLHGTQVELAAARAKIEGQQTMSAELRAYLDQLQASQPAAQTDADGAR